MLGRFSAADRSDLEKLEINTQELLYQVDLIVSRAPREDMIDLKQSRCEIAELLVDVWNPPLQTPSVPEH